MIERSYSLRNVSLSIGGFIVTGFGRTSAFEWGWTAGLWSRATGVDGQNQYQTIQERIIQATITVLGTSRAYQILSQLFVQQTGDGGLVVPTVLTPMRLQLIDRSTGDFIAGNCIFMTRPSPSKGQELGDAVFGIEIPNPRVDYGLFNNQQSVV